MTAPPIIDLASVDSTNLEARRRIAAGAGDRTIVTARQQTGGRARRGRSWSSPPGNLYWTQIRYPEPGWPPVWGLSMVAALAVRDLARAVLPDSVTVGLKWPNDVLVDGAKVAGILLESGETDGRPWVITGIGVNLVSAPAVGLLYAATSLAEAGAAGIGRDRALLDLAGHADRHTRTYLTDGLAGIRAAVLPHLLGVGGPITARMSDDGTGDVAGILLGLDAQCRALIETPGGEVQAISAGDMFLSGPASQG